MAKSKPPPDRPRTETANGVAPSPGHTAAGTCPGLASQPAQSPGACPAGMLSGPLVERLVHYIKNPLTVIGTFLQMLPNHGDGVTFQQDFLDIAMTEYYRVNELLEALLDAVEDEPPHCQWLNVAALVRGQLRRIDERCRRKSIRVDAHVPTTPLMAMVDETMIESAVAHLLENAVEAAPWGGSVAVETGPVDGTGAPAVYISISDSGDGLCEETAKHVFEPFFTTKSASPDHPCPGLGLYLAKKYVSLHDGRLAHDPSGNEATRFTMHLPIRPNGNRTQEPGTCASEH